MDENRFAKVNSVLGKKLGLLHMRGHEELGQPFSYELDLVSEDPDITLADLLGQPMAVEIEVNSTTKRFFHGIVAQFSFVGGHGRHSHYHALLRPWLWLLSKTADCRVFNKKAIVPDLVIDLMRERHFTTIQRRLSAHPPYREWEYRVQYRESEFNFISRLLEQEGIYYYFQHFVDKHDLVLADDLGSHDHTPEKTTPYYPPNDHEHRDVDHIDAWAMNQQIEPGGYITDDFNFEMPTQGLLRTPHIAPDKYAHGNYNVYDYPGEFEQGAQGSRNALVRLDELKTEHEVFRGSGNARSLKAGALFTLSGFPRRDQNRKYLVVAASYEITGNAFESLEPKPKEPVPYRCTITAIDATRPYRAASRTPKPKVDGPQTAIVVGTKPKSNGPPSQAASAPADKPAEITTDPYGRIRVQFHWDQRGTQDDDSSCWVRVAQFWASKGFGAQFIPRVGDEVIVDFLEGDPDRPIVVGSVYNAHNLPPYKVPANKTQSGIKTRSTPDGAVANFNEIRFEDKKGHEELYIQAEKTQTTLVKGSQSITVGGDRAVTVTGKETYTVKKERTTEITKKETLKVHDDVLYILDKNWDTAVDDSASVTVKNDYFLSTTDGGITLTHHDSKLNIAKSDDIYLWTENAQITLLKGGAITIEAKDIDVTIKRGDTQIVVDKDKINITATSTVQVSAQTVNIDAKQKVHAAVAGSTVELSADGVTVTGTMVKLNS